MFVCFDIANEDKSVGVFDLLHSGFSSQRMFDNAECIHLISCGNSFTNKLGVTSKLESFWAIELDTSTDLLLVLNLSAFDGLLLRINSFLGG